MVKLSKILEEMKIEFMKFQGRASPVIEIAIDYKKGLISGKDDDELNSPYFHWFLCQSLGDYLHFLRHPVYELKKGFLRKEDDLMDHIWIQLKDADHNILDPMAAQFNDPVHQMPDVYFGKKPEWYEEE